MGIKEKYQELSGKYKLPSFEELDNEFEVSIIEKDNFLLREIRRAIIEKIEIYIEFLEKLLNPETDLSSMYESSVFNEEDRKELFEVYKKIMFFHRLSVEVSIEENDEKTSEYLNKFLGEWVEIKKRFLAVVQKTKESWVKNINIDEKLRYMG
jgi:hypothetical protein